MFMRVMQNYEGKAVVSVRLNPTGNLVVNSFDMETNKNRPPTVDEELFILRVVARDALHKSSEIMNRRTKAAA
jgi:hypothetical protein